MRNEKLKEVLHKEPEVIISCKVGGVTRTHEGHMVKIIQSHDGKDVVLFSDTEQIHHLVLLDAIHFVAGSTGTLYSRKGHL